MPMIPFETDSGPEVTIAASPVCEMLSSLASLSMPRCPDEITAEAAGFPGDEFREEVRDLYASFNHGAIFMEFALGWDRRDDVPGFLDWVGGMDDREFVWYVLGRVVPLERIPTAVDPASLAAVLGSEESAGLHAEQWYINLRWATDLQAFRNRLNRLWNDYWREVFRRTVPGLKRQWERSVREEERTIRSLGLERYYSERCGKGELPEPHPPEMPYRHVLFVPSCRTPYEKATTFYGYGSIMVVYNCRIGTGEPERNREAQERLLGRFKSLSDETRLGVLQQIALNERVVNGKWLSARLKVSPSVVSRHLAQLKAAGLIEEFSEDNRNFTYALKTDAVQSLSGDLENFLLGILDFD